MALHANTQVFKLDDDLSPQDAVLFNPIGAGFDWAVRTAGTQVGDTVVVLGAGQRGLACVIAAVEAGAARVIVAGRGRRPWKLELARAFGATHVIDTDDVDLVTTVANITDGQLADRVVDTIPRASSSIVAAVSVAARGATVVLAGWKDSEGIPGLSPNEMINKAITIKNAYAVDDWATRQAIRLISSGRVDFERFHTHTFTIDDLDHAMRVLGGEVEGEEALHITVTPR
jgi:threonine dehydrogenase-like Zn-dependent dehydrogenase